MPLEKGNSKAVIRRNTEKLIHEGRPPDQAYAIANSEARRHPHGREHDKQRTRRG